MASVISQTVITAATVDPTRPRRYRSLDVAIIAVVVIIVLTAVIGAEVAPSSIFESHILSALQGPSSQHLLGTDDQGRDVLWRVIAGCQVTLLSSAAIVAGYSVIGVVIATLATMGARWIDAMLMGFTDLTLALPGFVLALGLAASLGPGLRSAIIAMIAAGWPLTTRMLRSVMRETMALPFVEGARVLGVSKTRLMIRHVLPNSLDVLIVKWAFDIGFTVIVLSGLSFLGVGPQPPSAEWGAMVAEAQSNITTGWWAALAPGAAIAITATAFGLLGDMLQVRRNPELRQR